MLTPLRPRACFWQYAAARRLLLTGKRRRWRHRREAGGASQLLHVQRRGRADPWAADRVQAAAGAEDAGEAELAVRHRGPVRGKKNPAFIPIQHTEDTKDVPVYQPWQQNLGKKNQI